MKGSEYPCLNNVNCSCNSENPNASSPIDREIVFDVIMTTIDMDC